MMEQRIELFASFLRSMPENAVWAPQGSGLEYEVRGTTGEQRTLKLKRSTGSPVTLGIAMNIESDCLAAGHLYEESKEMQIEPTHPNPEMAAHQEMMRAQEHLANMKCCDKPESLTLSDLPLERGVWISGGPKTVIDENGEETEAETWWVEIPTYCCDKVELNGDHYHLLAGDDYFFQTRVGNLLLRALTREEVTKRVDRCDLNNAMMIGTMLEFMGQQIIVPPHMRGLIVHGSLIMSGEEE